MSEHGDGENVLEENNDAIKNELDENVDAGGNFADDIGANVDQRPLAFTVPQFEALLRGIASTVSKSDINYSGLAKLAAPIFDGDTTLLYKWKAQFELTYKNRNLPKVDLALRLHDALAGDPKAFVDSHLTTTWDEGTYDKIMEILTFRYGGKFREDAYVFNKLFEAPGLDHLSVQTLESFHNMLIVQIQYYEKNDKQSLTNERSLLMQVLRRKLANNVLIQYMDWCKRYLVEEYPLTLLRWSKERLDTYLKTECLTGNVIDDSNTDSGDVHNTSGNMCPLCPFLEHEFIICKNFLKLSPKQRISQVKQSNVCIHCLRRGHLVKNCKYMKGKLCDVEDCSSYEHPFLHDREKLPQ